MKIPVVLVVITGDMFTLAKVAWAVQNDIVVVILHGSGAIANMLGDLVIEMEELTKRYSNSRFMLNASFTLMDKLPGCP